MRIVSLIQDGPADRAGLRTGDVLLRLDGEPVGDAGDLQTLMVSERIGRAVPAVVLRDRSQRTLTITLDELT